MATEPYEIQRAKAIKEDASLALALAIGVWAMYMGWI